MKSIVDIVIDKKHWFIFFAALLFFVIINQIRADFREHLYGKYSDNSAHTITSAQIWFNEKPWNVKFSSILSFKSIQYQNLNPEIHERHIGGLTFPVVMEQHLREVYISYPTGYLVPLYLLSIVLDKQPGQESLFLINSLNSILIFFCYSIYLISLRALETIHSYLFPWLLYLCYLLGIFTFIKYFCHTIRSVFYIS